jgi:endo-1,4-beta-D-glucanase Y
MNRLRYLVLLIVGFVLSLSAMSQQNSGNPAFPFPQERAYPFGFKATTITSADATAAYNSWKTSFAENCGGNVWRIKFDNNSETVSEGIGYGMLLAVYHADKTLFDGLWQYYKNARNENGVMHWKRNGCANTANGNNGATDAELDAAMALIIASCQWSTTSPHNYTNDAKALIKVIKDHEVEAGSHILKPGDKFGGTSLTNPSYFSPAYFKAYAEFTGTDAAFWNNVSDKCYQILNANAHATTGLVSDWCNGSGNPGGGGYAHGGVRFHYDAARTPWRIATDYLWNGTTAAQSYLQKNVNWVNGAGGGIANIGDSYERDGTKQSANHNSTFVGTFANAAMASSQANANSFAENFKNIPAANDNAYFQRTLRALYYLQLTGNFWYPCGVTPPVSSVIVAITSPTTSSVLSQGEDVVINATVSSNDGTITNVEFFYGDTKIGEDNSSPYSISWDAIPEGKHVLKVVATNSNNIKGEATLTVNVLKAFMQSASAPIIDGNVDALWSSHSASGMNQVIQGSVSGSNDLSVAWKALWTSTDVYVLAQITDDAKVNDSPERYNDDALELYFDIGNDKSTTYGSNDVQYTFRYNDNTVGVSTGGSTTGVVHAQTVTGTGYILEIKIPWTTLKNNSPAINQRIGFDIHINDDDNGGDRDGKMSWAATEDEAWQNPSFFGTIILKETNCTVPGAAGAISGNISVCQGVSETYSIGNVSNATSYTWTVPTGTTISSGQGTNTVQVLWGATGGTISVTPVNTCENGTASSKTVAATAASAASVSISANNTTICSGSSVVFTATPTNGGNSPTYQWKRNGNNINGATTATYSAGNLVNNDKITVVMTSNKTCVTSSPATSNQVVMNVSAKPTVANAGIDQYTPGANASLQGNTPSIGTGKWTRVSGSGQIANNTSANTSVTGLANGENIFSWTISNGACPASSDMVSVLVGSLPAKPTITGPTHVQENSVVTYSVSDNSDSQYTWTVSDGITILSGQGTNEITVSIPAGVLPGEISVTETNEFGSTNNSLILDHVTANLSSKRLQVNAYPNPFRGTIQVQMPMNETYRIKVTDINGSEVLKEFENSTSTVELGSDLNSGVYLLHITGVSSTEVLKVIKVD